MNTTVELNMTATADPAKQPFVVTVAVASLLTPAVIGTALYPLVLAAIVRNRKEFSSPYYAYLFSIGVSELFYLYYYGVYGTSCILYGACPGPLAFNRIASAFFGYALWYLEFATDLAIAIDRFLAICFYNSYAFFNTPKFIAAVIATTWIIAISFSMPMLSWVFPVSFLVDNFQENFEDYTDQVNLFNAVTWDILYAVLAIESLLYTSCAAVLFYHSRGDNSGSSGIRRAQRNLLIQSFLSITLLSSTVILTPYLDFTQVWPNYVLAFISQLVPINRLFIILALNSAIREEVWKILRCKNKPPKNVIRPARDIHVAASSSLKMLHVPQSVEGQQITDKE